MTTRTAFTALLLAAAVRASAADPAPNEAWRAARWGMSPAEVVAAFPGEATLLSPELKLANGTSVAAGIDAHSFEGIAFDVRFVFAGGKLSLVSLRTAPKTYVDAAAYEKLKETLVKRWGKPLEDAKDDNIVDQRQARWDRGPDRADLKFIPGTLVLQFYPRPGAAR